MDFPGGLEGKDSARNMQDRGSIPGWGRSSGEGSGNPLDSWVGKIHWRKVRLCTPVFWPGKFHGLYSPWDRKESDMTEQLSLSPALLPGESHGERSIAGYSTWGHKDRHNWVTNSFTLTKFIEIFGSATPANQSNLIPVPDPHPLTNDYIHLS